MVENSDFTPSQVGCLFTFLARQLAKPNNTLFVNRTLFDQVSDSRKNSQEDPTPQKVRLVLQTEAILGHHKAGRGSILLGLCSFKETES